MLNTVSSGEKLGQPFLLEEVEVQVDIEVGISLTDNFELKELDRNVTNTCPDSGWCD